MILWHYWELSELDIISFQFFCAHGLTNIMTIGSCLLEKYPNSHRCEMNTRHSNDKVSFSLAIVHIIKLCPVILSWELLTILFDEEEADTADCRYDDDDAARNR